MKLSNAGECLSFGLGHELMQRGYDGDNIPNYNLKAFITYFALIGYLSETTVKGICCILDRDIDSVSQMKHHFSEISKLLIRDLKKHVVFTDFEELTLELNKITIPDWTFETEGALLDLYPQVYLIHDMIYYMKEDNGRYYFRCVHTRKADELMEYSQDFFEDFDDALIEYDDTNHTISNKYSEIMGFCEEIQVFYLRFKHSNAVYAEYHVDTKQEVIHHYKCFGVVNNKFPVVEVEKKLSVVVGSEIKPIKDVDTMEEYEVKDGYIYVSPSYVMPVMFRPYVLLLDGERTEISHSEAVRYVLDKMRQDIFDCRGFLFRNAKENIEEDSDKDVTVFSLDYIDNFFLGKYNLAEDKMARIYHFIVRLLKSYLSSDEDVLDYFFMLAEVTKRLTRDGDVGFISEGVYWRLNEMHLTGKLSSVIKDVGELKKILLQDAYWDDESIAAERVSKINSGQVGYFTFARGRISAHTENIENTVCIGDMLMARWQESPGVVTYSLETGSYDIHYQRELSKDEVRMVLDTFHIIDAAYRIIIDRCPR